MRTGRFSFLKMHRWDVLIALLIFLEIAFMLFFRTREYPRVLNELAVFFISLSIGVAIILKYKGREVVYATSPAQKGGSKLRMISIAALMAGMAVFLAIAKTAFAHTPIDPAISDIIPMIQVAVRRLLAGEQVYHQPITLWGNLPVTYLPAHWLPYTLAEMLHFDYRWIAVAMLCIAAFTMLLRSSKVSGPHGMMVCSLLLFNGWMILQHEQGIITTTVEAMIAAYYMFLIMGISGRNPWLRGVAISLCLLSRYSLVLWLPLWAFIEWTDNSRKDFFRSVAVIVLIVACIYVVPFLLSDPGAFMRAYHYYTSAAEGEWRRLNPEGNPAHLYLGLGFARWFYEYLPAYSIPDRIHMLQRVHLLVSAGSTLALGAWYWRKRNILHPRIFAMASFKIYLTLFLNFIQVPYAYLMITATFVSIAIFGELARYKTIETSGDNRIVE